MKIFKIEDNYINLYADEEWQGSSIVITNRSNQGDLTDITNENILDSHEKDSGLVAKLDLHVLNIALYKLELIKNGNRLDFEDETLKFILDQDQLNSHAYMTRSLFGGGLVKLTPDELMYCVLCQLDVLPINNQFYGGLITLASFRVADSFEKRKHFIDKLNKKYFALQENAEIRSDHSTRWFLSASANLCIINLYAENEEQAKKILAAAFSKRTYNGIFPLTYLNYANLLALGGLLAIHDNNLSLAYSRLSECSNFCHYAVSDLFSPRNNFYFQHEFDVNLLVKLGYFSSAATAVLTNERHPSDSKFSFNLNHAPKNKFNTSIIFGRFLDTMKRSPDIAFKVENTLKEMLK